MTILLIHSKNQSTSVLIGLVRLKVTVEAMLPDFYKIGCKRPFFVFNPLLQNIDIPSENSIDISKIVLPLLLNLIYFSINKLVFPFRYHFVIKILIYIFVGFPSLTLRQG